MNNDLISRDELKKAIKNKYNYASATAFLLTMRNILPQEVVYQILAIIDDEPPAKATTPRGKWKHKDGIKFYFCNICGSGNNNGGGIKTNFCPNCGARMETGATDE